MIKLFLIFLLLIPFKVLGKTNLCIVLKKATAYSQYVKRMESTFVKYIDKKTFNVYVINHNSKLESIANAVKSVHKNNCKIIWGGATSSDSIMIVKLLNDSSILFVTPTSSSVKIKKIHEKTIYMSLDDEHVINSLYHELKNREGGISIIRNLSYPNTSNISKKLYSKLSLHREDIELVEILNGSTKGVSLLNQDNLNVVIPSYEADLVTVHNYLRKNRKRIYFGIDGWGSNSNIYKKFASNDKAFRAIKLDYWNKAVCLEKNFSQVCSETSKDLSIEFDSFAAIAYDSAMYINHLVDKKKRSRKFMTFEKVRDNGIIKIKHFYEIDFKSIRYRK